MPTVVKNGYLYRTGLVYRNLDENVGGTRTRRNGLNVVVNRTVFSISPRNTVFRVIHFSVVKKKSAKIPKKLILFLFTGSVRVCFFVKNI